RTFRSFDRISKQTIGEVREFSDMEDAGFLRHIAPYEKRFREETALLDGVYPGLDPDDYLKGAVAPVFFGSALNNFGVKELLESFLLLAPHPRPVHAENRVVDPFEASFAGFVFKIHANMDPNHRDRIAFIKVASGRFERNRAYIHVRTGKQMKFSSPTSFMAEKKSVIDEAFPGDIVGVHDTGNFKIGDAVTEGEKLKFKGIPSFSPELFRYVVNAEPMKFKQLARGLEQLTDEGVAQLFVSKLNGRKIIGTVGALQLDVIQYRLQHEYGARCSYEPIPMYKACWIDARDMKQLEKFRLHKNQQLALDREDREVYMSESPYALQMAQEKFPGIIFHFSSEY
ncbi:MAG TPA: peptide chain release factor 3, partial [Bacteroides sp.]|nr:peptide chain release factor 3 [Bacteroides sp.]